MDVVILAKLLERLDISVWAAEGDFQETEVGLMFAKNA